MRWGGGLCGAIFEIRTQRRDSLAIPRITSYHTDELVCKSASGNFHTVFRYNGERDSTPRTMTAYGRCGVPR